MEKQPSQNSSATSSPLSRVHRRQPRGQKDAASAASDDEFSSEKTQHLTECFHNEDQESTVRYTDAIKPQGSAPNQTTPNSFARLQNELASARSLQTFADADDKDAGIDTVQSCDGDDVPYSEFSQLRLQLKSLMRIQAKVTGNEEADLPGIHLWNINTKPTIEPYPIIVSDDYSDVGGSDGPLQDRNCPSAVGKSYFEPDIFKQQIQLPEAVDSQKTETGRDSARSLSEALATDCMARVINPESPRYPHEVIIDVKTAEPILYSEPLTSLNLKTFVRPRSLLPVAQIAPPREIILSPIQIPQTTLKRGPTVTFIAKPVPGLVKVDAGESATKKTSTPGLSEDNVAPQQPPPPYSECMQYMASPTFGNITQPAPKVNRKTLQSQRTAESLASPSRASPHLYAQEAGYSQLHNSGTSLLDADMSVYNIRNKSDCQVSLTGGGRTTFVDNEHQFLAFISCLFCWPIGLVAIYYSNMCQILKAEGNYAQAQVYSRQAFIVSTLAMCAGSLTYVIMLIYQKMW